MTFARHQFELSEPQEDGSPLRAHLEAVWRATGKRPEMLANAPTLPASCRQLWSDFLELHGSRGATGFGLARITFTDIDAWERVNNVKLSPWDIAAIRKVDDLWMSEFAPKPRELK